MSKGIIHIYKMQKVYTVLSSQLPCEVGDRSKDEETEVQTVQISWSQSHSESYLKVRLKPSPSDFQLNSHYTRLCSLRLFCIRDVAGFFLGKSVPFRVINDKYLLS